MVIAYKCVMHFKGIYKKKDYNTKQKGQIKTKTILPGRIGKVYKGGHLSDVKD